MIHKYMTYVGAEYSVNDLFKEIQRRTAIENIHTFDEYKDSIDEIIEEKKSYGFFRDEEDLEQIRSDLELRWREIEETLQ